MGTPPQTLNVAFDTRSPDFWVAGSQCTNCSANTPRFDPTKSSSYAMVPGPQVSLALVDGPLRGTNSTETVALGPFILQDQGFSMASLLPVLCILMSEWRMFLLSP